MCDAGSKNREAEISLISDAFIACDYPVQRVDSLIQNYTPKSNNNNKKESEDKRNKIFLPYIPKISDTFKRQLNKQGLNVIFLRGRTIGQWLCNNKPKGIPKRWKQKIHKIPCEFILVKQVFGLTKERTNTSLHSKDVTSAIVLLLT